MNVSNNTAAIERLGHIIANTSADIDNANHNIPLVFTNNGTNDLKSSFEEFSRNFVGYRGAKNNRNVSNLANRGLSTEEPSYCQLDNKPRPGETDNVLRSISEGMCNVNPFIFCVFHKRINITVACNVDITYLYFYWQRETEIRQIIVNWMKKRKTKWGNSWGLE